MKKRVLIVPLDAVYEQMMLLMQQLNDQNFQCIIEKSAIIKAIRDAGKTAEVDWTE